MKRADYDAINEAIAPLSEALQIYQEAKGRVESFQRAGSVLTDAFKLTGDPRGELMIDNDEKLLLHWADTAADIASAIMAVRSNLTRILLRMQTERGREL